MLLQSMVLKQARAALLRRRSVLPAARGRATRLHLSAALRDRGIDRRANSASLYRMAPPGPMAMSRSRCWGHSQLQPPFPAETPFDAASSAHRAGDMLADALVEHGLPRHQLEADAVIDHGEAAVRQLG